MFTSSVGKFDKCLHHQLENSANVHIISCKTWQMQTSSVRTIGKCSYHQLEKSANVHIISWKTKPMLTSPVGEFDYIYNGHNTWNSLAYRVKSLVVIWAWATETKYYLGHGSVNFTINCLINWIRRNFLLKICDFFSNSN